MAYTGLRDHFPPGDNYALELLQYVLWYIVDGSQYLRYMPNQRACLKTYHRCRQADVRQVLTRKSSLPHQPSLAQTSPLPLACMSWSSVPMRASVQSTNMARRNSPAWACGRTLVATHGVHTRSNNFGSVRCLRLSYGRARG